MPGHEQSPAPLTGVRVLDFTMNLPGPYATMVLASLGAEVIKIEPPRGDTARNIGRLFDLVNRGKKSVVVDLKNADGRTSIEPLLSSADVIIEGFRPGVMAGFGLDSETLRSRFPRLVYCSVSGFGQSGPYRDYPAHDLNLQAVTGVCHMMRDADDHPWGCALPIADLSSGLTASTAIVAALFARERNGVGRAIDVALCDTVLSWAYVWEEGLNAADARLSDAVGPVNAWLARQRNPVLAGLAGLVEQYGTPARVERVDQTLKRTRRFDQIARLRLHALPHYGVYETADGRWLSIAIVDEGKFWRALCQALSLPGPVARLPGAARFVAGGPLRRLVARALRRKPLQYWMDHFDRTAIPVTAVVPLSEALRDPQLQTRIRGQFGAAMPASLVPLNTHNVSTQAPRLGEHNPHFVDG